MKTSRFSEPQILAILRQAEGGVPESDQRFFAFNHGKPYASKVKAEAGTHTGPARIGSSGIGGIYLVKALPSCMLSRIWGISWDCG